MSSALSTSFEPSLVFPLPEGCLVRPLDAHHLEVWGSDISEHYLLCYDERQSHLLDVFYIPFDAERQHGMD
jgi:hypothetical protein